MIGHLEGLAEEVGPGLAWHTSPGFLPDARRPHWPRGYYDLVKEVDGDAASAQRVIDHAGREIGSDHELASVS